MSDGGLYLYCIVPAGHDAPEGLRGVDGAPVRAEAAGPLVAWVSPLPSRPEPTLERVREHDAVVRAAASSVTPLPARFGEFLGDAGALRARLAAEEAALLATLEAVRDAEEFGVNLRNGSGSPPSPGPVRASEPRAYLRELAARHAEERRVHAWRDDLVGVLRDHVADAVRDERVYGGRGGALGSVAHLVPRSSGGRYRAGLEAFKRAAPDVEVVVTGPWPPYSFVR